MPKSKVDSAKETVSKVVTKVKGALSKQKDQSVSPAQYRREEAPASKPAKKHVIKVKSEPAEEPKSELRSATKRYVADQGFKPSKKVRNARAKGSRLNKTGGSTRKRARKHLTKGR